ncbi:hypothetical protein [uncultured Enterovirga sp.]|uniref:hypothetical protein n=1 Tax=uncultured Enterovirga sp. TaxID=2026352 RepID=UPI0035CB9A86
MASMSTSFEQELKAEIESFRAEIKERKERREQEQRDRDRAFAAEANVLLDPDHIRNLITEREENARLRKRLEAAERRIAELEKRNG